MRERLLQFLVCPQCAAEFELEAETWDAGHVLEGRLRCRGCGALSLIEGGVPAILEVHHVNEENRRTADRFGYEWDRFDFLSESYERQFLDWIWPVDRGFFRGKLVLDAGCGKARHTVLAARFGAHEVLGVDLAQGSVRAAFRNTKDLHNVHIVRADLHKLPFRPGVFEYVYSIGVLHHTPDPARAFRTLAEVVRAGGTLSVWVYGAEGNWWILRIVDPIRRLVTARLPLGATRAIAFVLALLLQSLLKGVYKPVNEIGSLKPLARWLFYNDYLYYISRFSFRENYSIVFDHLLPEIAHYVARDEVLGWYGANGFVNVVVTQRTNNSWRGKGDQV